jgi:hypothetical protein
VPQRVWCLSSWLSNSVGYGRENHGKVMNEFEVEN